MNDEMGAAGRLEAVSDGVPPRQELVPTCSVRTGKGERCSKPATTDIGLPMTDGGTLWIGPWCDGHSAYMRHATSGPGVSFRSVSR